MEYSFARKILTTAAVLVVLLGLLSPVAAGVLLCIGDGSGPDCCGDSLGESAQLQDGSDCDCCIALDAAPRTAGANSHKASLDVVLGSTLLRDVALPSRTRGPGAPNGAEFEARLSSLRTVVLLI